MPTKYYTKALPLPNGKRKYIRGKTPEELAEKVAKAERELALGLRIDDHTTVSQLAQLWFDTYKKGKVKPGSESTIRTRLNLHIVPQIGGMRVRDVKPVHIQMMMNVLGENTSSANYQKQILETAHSIFEMAVDNDIILKNPATKRIEIPGSSSSERIPLSQDEQRLLLSAADSLPPRFKNFYLLLIDAGLRPGEIKGLMFSDIDFERGLLYVRHQIVNTGEKYELVNYTKTPAGIRTVPLSERLWQQLKIEKERTNSVYVCHREDGGPFTRSDVNRAVTLADRIVRRHVHPHLLRHTCITNWVSSGKFTPDEVRYMAGHSDISMTMNVYDHYVERDRIEETAQKMRRA